MPTFSDLLKSHYEQAPDKVCVTLLHAGQPDLPVTYAELIRAAAGYAETYRKNDVHPGDVVLLILQHGIDLLYAYYGTILHGAIPSIMPFLTEKLLPERYRADLAALVSVTQPTAIVTYPDFEPEVRAALKPGEDSVKAVIVSHHVAEPCAPDFSLLGGLKRRPEDIVLLQHSSGTTGLQKGVALSHQAVLNQLQCYGETLHLEDEDVFVSWLPLYHDMGLIACWLMPILLGYPLVILSPFDWIRAPYRLLQAVSKYKGTLSWLPNFTYNFCAQKIRDRDLAGVDLSSWRAISNCSEPMRWDSHQAFYERFKNLGLKYETLATCYAMAENVFAVTQGGIDGPVMFEDIDRDSLQVEKIARPAAADKPVVRMLGAGKAIPNTEVQVLDAAGQPLPDRHVGEVALKSDCMLTGYYHRPDATKKAFVNGWYLTGDYGYLVEGELYITGRKKDLIIVGGKNIYPQDLELLAYEVAGVHAGRASAFGVFNDANGTEDVVMVAEVDCEDPAERQKIADAIRMAVTRGLAVALRFVHLVGKHWLVKTSSGKTARSANREKFLKEMQEKDRSSRYTRKAYPQNMPTNPKAPLFHKIDCVRLHVPDLEAALAFYRDRLGQRMLWRTEQAAGLGMPETDSEIVLFTEGSGEDIDFLVDSADEAAARLVEAGGKVIFPPFDIQVGRCVVVEDPWGNKLVLMDLSKGLLKTDPEGNVIGNLDA